jgi:hypothetical protein
MVSGSPKEVNNLLLARLRENPGLTRRVHQFRTGAEAVGLLEIPYVMVYADAGHEQSERMANEFGQTVNNYTIHEVGETQDQVWELAQLVKEQLVGWRPRLDGRTFWKCKNNFVSPINTNNAIKPPILYTVGEWELRHTKGASNVPPSP